MARKVNFDGYEFDLEDIHWNACPISGKEGIGGKVDDRVALLSPPDPKTSFHIESVSKEALEC